MSLVPEDGTGLVNSNTYISAAFADTYHDERGNTKWENASVAERESALIRASDYIDKRWGVWFRGIKSSSIQALQWPRIGAFDNNRYTLNGIVPVPLQKACAEYALRAFLNNVLAPDPHQTVPEQNHEEGSVVDTEVITGEIQEKEEKVGPIEERTVYRTSSQNRSLRTAESSLVDGSAVPQYPEADLWMAELTKDATSRRIARG